MKIQFALIIPLCTACQPRDRRGSVQSEIRTDDVDDSFSRVVGVSRSAQRVQELVGVLQEMQGLEERPWLAHTLVLGQPPPVGEG